ncbi:KpsF/GutQ family sugar-phosphate isomerase [Chitinibacteraceae bacterium HSL-7]
MSMTSEILRRGSAVLINEADALQQLAERLDSRFEHAIRLILACTGRIVVTGMGKSGHIARKIAATLASTGTPALFVHPAEAAHGDLGMITGDDVVIALSHSGESDEVVALLPSLKRLGVKLIAMTGREDASISRAADVWLDTGVEREACPHNLAPTTSTTATLALGDALAVVVLEERGFKPEDFALSHPGGTLGRKLLVRVSDLMHGDASLPIVSSDTTLSAALLEISRKGLGFTAIVDDGVLSGIFTDGDLRRAIDRGIDVRDTLVDAVMTANPATIRADALASAALAQMEQRRCNGLLVTNDQGKLVGAINMHDLLRARIV